MRKPLLLLLCGVCLYAHAEAPVAGDHDRRQHLVAGKLLFTQGAWDKAIHEFKKETHDHPDFAEAWMWLGRALGRKAENSNPIRAAFLVEDIRHAFEHAVQLDPKNMDARGDLLNFYLEAPSAFGGGLDKARTEADAIAKLNKADGLMAASQIAEKEEKFRLAEHELQTAIEANPNPERYRELAQFYKRRKNYVLMEEAFRKSDDRKSHYFLAESLMEQRQKLPEAAKLAQQFLTAGPTEPGDEPTIAQGRLLLGQIAARQGHREEAVRELRAALQENPNLKAARKELERLE